MAAPPTGTVTFLFTDVEGSTRLWEQHPDAMGPAMARHDAIIETLAVRHGGLVVRPRGEGDSRFCVFDRAADAVVAVAAIQRALLAEPWPTPTPIRVRAALHTGEADLRAGDYYGSEVNRCARLRAIAQGGQTLLSQATADLFRQGVDEGLGLRDLGEQRLRDLERPEHVFQLYGPGLPDGFTPLRSLEPPPNNLPIHPSSFIGRAEELAEVRALVGSSRLVSLIGTGGIGKTRLAVELAVGMLDGFPDGAWLVELAPIPGDEPDLVLQTVARTLALKESPTEPVLKTLVEHLRSKRALLLLDGCEHLVQACAAAADALLRACPELHVLATSRERLGIDGEASWRVPSLRLPLPSEDARSVEQLAALEAVRLFVERARSAEASFALTPANAPAVAQICTRLDGIPLALELAAARVRILTPQQIAERLDDRFRLLTEGSRVAPRRHQTLRALFDWSRSLLSEGECVAWRRLSVFVGGWSLEGARTVCQCDDIEMLDLLAQLEEKSLVLVEEQAGEKRYAMLESVREYGLEGLREAGEVASVRARQLEWCTTMAERAGQALYGPEQEVWLARLELEHGNARSALRWAAEAGDGAAGLRLGAALWLFWLRRGYLREGQDRLKELLALPGASPGTASRAKACNGAGTVAFFLGDYRLARELGQESLAIYTELGDRPGVAAALGELGRVARVQGDYDAARGYQVESLAVHRALGDKRSIAQALFGLGLIDYQQGSYDLARGRYAESLTLYREVGNHQAIAAVQGSLAKIATVRGDYAEASARMAESLATFRRLGERWNVATALDNLGFVALLRQDWASARALFAECLTVRLELGGKQGMAEILEGYGALAAGEGQPERALRLAGAADAVRERIDSPLGPSDRARLERLLEPASRALGDAAAAAAWARGRELTLDEAIALAQEATSPAAPSYRLAAPRRRHRTGTKRFVARVVMGAEPGQAGSGASPPTAVLG